MYRMMLGATALMLTIPAMAQPQAPQAQVTPPAAQAAPPIALSPQRMDITQTRDQAVAKVRAHFAQMDANRDGFVAGDELTSMRGHHEGKRDERRERRQQAAFEWLDRNRDNMISREEYDSVRQLRGQTMGARGTAPMAMPGDRPARRMDRMGGQMGGGMMRMADLDRDGRISLQEATTSALQRFDRVDINRDGTITPDERRQQREQRKERRAPKAG